MFGGFGGFGGYGGGWRGGGNPVFTAIFLIIIAAVAGWKHGGWEVKILIIAGVVFAGRAAGLFSTAFCLKFAVCAAAVLALFGVNMAAVAGATVLASSWHFWRKSISASGQNAARRQEIFFDGIFSLLGYVAKADGVVCGKEINFASALMAQMQLNEERRAHARALFRRGKEADFDIEKTLRQVRKECAGSVEMFMRILADAAAIDGNIGEVEKRVLHYVGSRLGLSPGEVEQIEAAVRGGGANRSRSYGDYGGGRDNRARAGGGGLLEAYKILGVASSASDKDVKRSYRRLMSRHHPDKLAAKGVPPEMMRAATERAQEISGAYERIKKARGM